MARALGAVAAVAMAAGAMAMPAPAGAAAAGCDKKIVYAEGAVRVARPGGEYVACLGDRRHALNATAVSAIESDGPFLHFNVTDEGSQYMDLRSGKRHRIYEHLGLTASGFGAYLASAGGRGGYGVAFYLLSIPTGKQTELTAYGCGLESGCDPTTEVEVFALAPDATAYWQYADGRLDSAIRSEAAVHAPAPAPFKARKRPCVSSIVSARNQRRVAALSADKAGYCLGGKLRHKLGNAHGFHWAGDWLTYFRRGEHFDALRLLNVVTGEDRVLAPGDIRSSIDVVGALKDGTVAWVRTSSGAATSVELLARSGSTGESRMLESWCSGVACEGEQSKVVDRGFALAPEGLVFWRAPDGTVGTASAR